MIKKNHKINKKLIDKVYIHPSANHIVKELYFRGFKGCVELSQVLYKHNYKRKSSAWTSLRINCLNILNYETLKHLSLKKNARAILMLINSFLFLCEGRLGAYLRNTKLHNNIKNIAFLKQNPL